MPVNQDAQQRIVQKILENAPVDDSVRDQAWNAFFTADDRVSFVQQFQAVPLPQSVKRQLWFAKFPEAYTKLPEGQRNLGDPELESFVRSGGKWIELSPPSIVDKASSGSTTRPEPSQVYTVDLGRLGIGRTPTEHIRPVSEEEYRAGSKIASREGGSGSWVSGVLSGAAQMARPGGYADAVSSGWLANLIGSLPIGRRGGESGSSVTPQVTSALTTLPAAAPTPVEIQQISLVPKFSGPEVEEAIRKATQGSATAQATPQIPAVTPQAQSGVAAIPQISLVPKFSPKEVEQAIMEAKAKPQASFWEALPAWLRSAADAVAGAIGPSVAIPEAGAPMVPASAPPPVGASRRQNQKAQESKASGKILDAIAEGIKGAIQSIGSMPVTPEAGVPLAVPQNKEEMQKIGQVYHEALTTPAIPLSEMAGEKPGYWRGVAKAVEPMLSPLGVTSAGVAAPVMAASPAAALALGSAGAVAASIGLGKKLREAYEHVAAGRYDMAKEAAGEATIDGVFAVLMAHAAKRGAMDIYQDLLNRYRSWRATIVSGPKQLPAGPTQLTAPPNQLPAPAKQLPAPSAPAEPAGPAPSEARPVASAESAPEAAGAAARPAGAAAPKAEPARANVEEAPHPKAETVAGTPAGNRVPPTPEEVERMAARLAAEISSEETGGFTEPPRPSTKMQVAEAETAEKIEVKPPRPEQRVAVKEPGQAAKEILGEAPKEPETQKLDPETQRIIENYRWMSDLDENTASKVLAHIESFGEDAANGWKMIQVGDRIVVGDPGSRTLIVFNSVEDALRYAKEHPLPGMARAAAERPAVSEAKSAEPSSQAQAGASGAKPAEGMVMPEVQRTEPPRPSGVARAEREESPAASGVAAAAVGPEVVRQPVPQQQREQRSAVPLAESSAPASAPAEASATKSGAGAASGERLAANLAAVLSDINWPNEYDANTIASSYRDLAGVMGEGKAKEELLRRGAPQQVVDVLHDSSRLDEYIRSRRNDLLVGRKQREVAMRGIPTSEDLAGSTVNDRIELYVEKSALGPNPVDQVLFWDAGLAIAKNRRGQYDLYVIDPATGLMRHERTFENFDQARDAAYRDYAGRRIDAATAISAGRALSAGAHEFQKAMDERMQSGRSSETMLKDTTGIAYHGNFGYSITNGAIKLFVQDDNGDVIYQTKELPDRLKNLIVVRDGLRLRLDYDMIPAVLVDPEVNADNAYDSKYAENARKVSDLARRSLSDLYWEKHGVHLGPQFEVETGTGKKTVSFVAPTFLQNALDGYVNVEIDGALARAGIVRSRDALREALYDALVEAGGQPSRVRGLTPEARAILNNAALVSDLASRAKSAGSVSAEPSTHESPEAAPAPERAPAKSVETGAATAPKPSAAIVPAPAPSQSEPPRPSSSDKSREDEPDGAPATKPSSESHARAAVPTPAPAAQPAVSSEPPRPAVARKEAERHATTMESSEKPSEPPKPKRVESAGRLKAVNEIADPVVNYQESKEAVQPSVEAQGQQAGDGDDKTIVQPYLHQLHQKNKNVTPESTPTSSRQDKASLRLVRDILQDVGISKDNWYSLYKSDNALLFASSPKSGSMGYELNYSAKIADLPPGVEAESGSVKPDRVLELLEKAIDGSLDITKANDISGYLGVHGRYPVINRDTLDVLSGAKPRGEEISLSPIQRLSEEIAHKMRDDYRAVIIEGGHYAISSGNVSAGGLVLATDSAESIMSNSPNAFIGDLKGVLAFAKFGDKFWVNYKDGVISAKNVAASGEVKSGKSLIWSASAKIEDAPVSAEFLSEDLKAAIRKMGSYAGYQYWFVPLEDRIVVIRTKYDPRKPGYYVAGKAGAGMLAIPAKVNARKGGQFLGVADGSALVSFLKSLSYGSEVKLGIFGDDSASIVMHSPGREYIGFKNIYLFGGGLSAAKIGIKNLDAGYGSAMLVQDRTTEPARRPSYRSSGSSKEPDVQQSEPTLPGASPESAPTPPSEPQAATRPEDFTMSSGPAGLMEQKQASGQYSEPPRPSKEHEGAQKAQAEAKLEQKNESNSEQKAEAQSIRRTEGEPNTEAKPKAEAASATESSEPPKPRKEKPSEATSEKASKPVTIEQQASQKTKLSEKLRSEEAKAIAKIAEESESLPHEQRVGENSPEYAAFRKRFAKAIDYIYSHRAQYETAGKISDLEQWMAIEALLDKAYRAYVDRRFKETMSPIELEYNARMMQVFPGIEDYVSADMLNSTQLSKIGEAFHPHTSTLKKAIADVLRALDRVGSSIAAPIPLRIDDLDKRWRQLSQESTKNPSDRPPDDSAAALAGREDISEKPMGLPSGSKLGRPQVNYWPPRYPYSEAWGIRLSYEQRKEIQRDSIANVLLTVLDGRDYSSKRDHENAGYYFYNRRSAEWFADYIGGVASYDQFVSIIEERYGKPFPALVELLSSEALAGYYKFRKVNFASSRQETKYANTIVINAVKSAGTRTLNAAALLAQALGGYAYSDGVFSFTNNEQGAQRFMNILETGMVPQEVLAYAASIALASRKTKLIDALVSQIHSPAQDDSGETAWSGKGRVVAEIKDERISKAIVQSCGSDWTPVGVDEISKRYPDLLPYQADGVARAIYALDKHGGFLLMDGAGAGKTSQIMAVARHYLDQGKKVVLISRANALKIRKTKDGAALTGSYAEWAERIGVPVHVVASPDQVPKELQPGKLYVGNYSHYSLNKKYPVDKDTILILDEAHALKNFDSNATLNAMPNIDEAAAVMYATATPIDQPQHIHYLKRIDIYEGNEPETALTKLGLVRRTRAIKRGDKIETIVEWAANPALSPSQIASRLDALFWRLGERGLALRREISLRGVDVYMRQVDLPQEARDVMAKIEAAFIEIESPSAAALTLMHQRRQLETYKVDDVVKITKEELAAGRSVVIFASRINTSEVAVKYVEVDPRTGERSEYKDVIHASEGTTKLIKDALLKGNIVKESEIVEVHGNAEGKQSDAIDKFQSNKAKVMIATVESGGVGINLDDTTGARPRTMIIMTPPFDAVNNIQAICRIWRVNTKSYPKVYYLRGDHKVDNWNFDIISRKMKYLHAAVKNEVRRVDVEAKDVLRAEELSARAMEERVMNELLLYRAWPYDVYDIRNLSELSDITDDDLEKTILALAKRGLLKLMDGVKDEPSDENRARYVYDEGSKMYYRRVSPNLDMLKASK